MIVADTGAVLALLDRDDRHHVEMRTLFEADPAVWLLPWAILPEVDYLVSKALGGAAERAWLADVASGAFSIEWPAAGDLPAASAIAKRYATLEIGMVDAIVMTTAERLRADIATLDLRHFGAVRLVHEPRLLPRDGNASRSRRATIHRPTRGSSRYRDR